MRLFLCCLIIISCLTMTPAFAKQNQQFSQGMPPQIPPEALEQIKRMLPPGVQLPPGLVASPGAAANAGNSAGVKRAANTPLPPEPSYTPLPAPASAALYPFGSGRTLQQREAALFTVNAELDRLPCILPLKKDAPSRDAILKIADMRNASARKKFGPNDLSAYSRTVTWIPRFDGLQPNVDKAREYSLLVSAATNYFSEPYFIMALASAVFSLDPQSTANANNFASAVAAGGERLHAGIAGIGDLAPYRSEAESIYRYALAVSMKGDDWGEESFTTILNLGYLYVDMERPEEARSLFQVARKLKPFSWDAAQAMAAYFHAIGQPDKALAILEDPKLDKPMMLMVARKSAKILEKSDVYAGLPADTPAEKFAEGIKVMSSEPIATAADFVAQIDQSERNKMRYFVEHLPPAGSFSAPKINKLTQYASSRTISSPQGQSALREFGEMLQAFTVSSAASVGKEQLKMLSRLGMDMDLGIDLDDVANHPEKYTSKKGKMKIKPKIDKSKLMANIENLKKQAKQAERELATGKTATLTEIAAQIEPFTAIVAMNPEDYADPMNIIIQKHNFAVHNRKTNLYTGYLYSENKRILRVVQELQKRYWDRMQELRTIRDDAEKKLEESGKSNPILKHKIHTDYFNGANAAADAAFGSATNVTSYAYVNNIKPMAEAYYYDVIRHVGLISDPEVRDQKDADLRRSINSALVQALSTVLSAHGSFPHFDEWDCGCSENGLAEARKEEREAFEREEEARIARSKAGKARFDSKDIPKSTPLWKKLDAFGTDLNIPFVFFLSGRISCARTEVKLNTGALPLPNIPQLFGAMTVNEFTGATQYDGGVTVGISKDFAPGSSINKITANIGLNGSISTDGNWNVRDYSVTPSTELAVQAGNSGISVKGQMTFGPNGELRDSDFSAGISQDFKNGFGTSGKVAFEASTKRGCTLSGKVTGSIMPQDAGGKDVDKSPWESIKDENGKVMTGAFAGKPITDKFHKKELWSGKFCFKEGGCKEKKEK